MTEHQEQALIKAYDAVMRNPKISKESIEDIDWLVYEMRKVTLERFSRKEVQEFLHRTRRVIYPVDGEYLAQTNRDISEIARDGLPFAMYILDHASEISEKYLVAQALEFVGRCGNWREIEMEKTMKRALYVRNYGEEEVEAMEEAGEIMY